MAFCTSASDVRKARSIMAVFNAGNISCKYLIDSVSRVLGTSIYRSSLDAFSGDCIRNLGIFLITIFEC